MTRSVTGLWAPLSAGIIAPCLLAGHACAQEVVTDDSVAVRDVALMPLADLNLSKDEIPAVLVRAQAAPYANPGFDDCSEIRDEIGDLDAVLGEDFDMPDVEATGGVQFGKMARSVVGMLIPYRGVIREISGANRHEREFKESIVAGMMRRAYLKGLGEAMDCPYPARTATDRVIATSILVRDPAPFSQSGQEQTAGNAVPVDEPGARGEPRVVATAIGGDRDAQ